MWYPLTKSCCKISAFLTCLTNKGPSRSGSSKHFSSSPRKKLWMDTDMWFNLPRNSMLTFSLYNAAYALKQGQVLQLKDSATVLFVPVIDLMDVSKNNLVFSFHVIWNSFLFHSAHVALKERATQSVRSTSKCWPTTMSENLFIQIVFFSYLHHWSQVSDIVSLSLHQLQKYITERKNTQKLSRKTNATLSCGWISEMLHISTRMRTNII